MKAAGKRTVVVTFDTWGNSYRGLIGYNEVSVDGKPVVGVGGWGSSGAKEEIGPHPLESLLSPMDGQKFPETTSPISPFPRHYFMVFEMLEALDG